MTVEELSRRPEDVRMSFFVIVTSIVNGAILS
jgi:hypothetical protein